MGSADVATKRFEPEPSCASAARRFVLATLDGWDLDRFHEDVALCSAELAANAILHSRTPFTVSVRPTDVGIRVDVQDDRPDRLPELPPAEIGPLQTGTTGRGLKLVAALASRWGYFTTELAKTVWVELTDEGHQGAVSPVVELARRHPVGDAWQIRLLGLPVKTAVASGAQVDDLVRELQLQPDRLSPEEQRSFLELLERSAPPRLAGRHAAFRAASQGLDRFDLNLSVSPEEVKAVTELGAFLEWLARRAVIDSGRPDPAVTAMRAWLPAEAARQAGGEKPSPFPG